MQYWRSEHLTRGDSERDLSWVPSKITSKKKKKPIEIQQTNKGSNKEKKEIKKRKGTSLCFSLLPSVSPLFLRVLSPVPFLSLSLIPTGGEGQEIMGSGQQGELARSLLIPGSLQTGLAHECSVLERTYVFFERMRFGFLSFSTKLHSNGFKNCAFRQLQHIIGLEF